MHPSARQKACGLGYQDGTPAENLIKLISPFSIVQRYKIIPSGKNKDYNMDQRKIPVVLHLHLSDKD